MITRVSVYMCPWGGAKPFAYTSRGAKVSRTYSLTKASSQRLSHACLLLKGRFAGRAQGWTWARDEK